MNRNTLRMAAVSAVAALAIGGGAGLAQASTAPAVPAATAQSAPATQQAEAQQAARALLSGPLAGQLSAAERTEITQIANGEASAASRWTAIKAAFSKVGGFAKAIGGKFSDFKKWYDGLSWYAKLPLQAVTPGLTLWDIYNALH